VNEEQAQPIELPQPSEIELKIEGRGFLPLARADNVIANWLNAHPRIFQGVLWSVVLGAVGVGTALYFTGMLEPRDAGYPSVFVINLIGSATVIIPVPGLLAACTAAAPSVGLNLLALGLIGATGATLGETTGYLAGYGGQSFAQKSRHYARVQGLVLRRGALALFILAALPTPLFDIAGIASGSLGYPLRRFLFWVFLGKAIKFIGIAYACFESIDWIKSLLNL
jgi:membrane protein YqaA with SNARE-associated domain